MTNNIEQTDKRIKEILSKYKHEDGTFMTAYEILEQKAKEIRMEERVKQIFKNSGRRF